jgi:hypothetical protein
VFKLSKAETLVTLKTEKQKDAEQAADLYFDMEQVAWASGLQEEQRTLVPALKTAQQVATDQASQLITIPMIHRAFGQIADAWGAGNPLSHKPQTRKDGRFAPLIFARQIGGKADEWEGLVTDWLANECLMFDQVSTVTKRKGLRVLALPGSQEE